MNVNVHELKTDPIPFYHTDAGIKTSEVRFDDRGFRQGDYLLLRETKHTGEEMKRGASLGYTGFTIMVVVTHIHEKQGMNVRYVAMSIEVLRGSGRKYGD